MIYKTITLCGSTKFKDEAIKEINVHEQIHNYLFMDEVNGVQIGITHGENVYGRFSIHAMDVISDKIPEGAFKGWVDLKRVNILNAKIISKDAFINCQDLEIVDLNKDVTTIGDNAFRNCASLKYMELPETLEVIGDSAFRCSALSEIEFPSKLERIGESAFRSCMGLLEAIIPEDTEIKAIPEFCFAESGIKEIKIPGKIGWIKTAAFADSNIEKVWILEDCATIDKCAFENCENLKWIQLPSTLRCIKSGAFYNCNNFSVNLYRDKGSYLNMEEWPFEKVRDCKMYILDIAVKGEDKESTN